MSGRQVVLEDLAGISPGPQLSAALSGIDLARLSGFDCVEVLKARYRQLNHDRAHVMAAVVEVGLRGRAPAGDLTRIAVPDEFSADEIRAALMLTRRAADTQLDLAYDLIARLPAMHAGLVDEPRARLLSEWTTELSPEQARGVCDAVLPEVPTLTTGQLIEQIKKMAIAIDPAWAQRRYEQAVTERNGLDDATLLERLRTVYRDDGPTDDGVADREDEPDHNDSDDWRCCREGRVRHHW